MDLVASFAKMEIMSAGPMPIQIISLFPNQTRVKLYKRTRSKQQSRSSKGTSAQNYSSVRRQWYDTVPAIRGIRDLHSADLRAVSDDGQGFRVQVDREIGTGPGGLVVGIHYTGSLASLDVVFRMTIHIL